MNQSFLGEESAWFTTRTFSTLYLLSNSPDVSLRGKNLSMCLLKLIGNNANKTSSPKSLL